jgi:hypothetical protein
MRRKFTCSREAEQSEVGYKTLAVLLVSSDAAEGPAVRRRHAVTQYHDSGYKVPAKKKGQRENKQTERERAGK